jgi:phosphoglycerate dehydrogenase-like enzyme|tara:strand:+ start:232 stop:1239 length:1008 start_codon:yes stop_codon:yes gene_type:complete
MRDPLVAVVDWKQSPRGDSKCIVEKEVLGKSTNVKYFLCNNDSDWKGNLLEADVILLWHNTHMSSTVINKLQDCKAIIRNGTGYDTVDWLAAASRDIPVCNVPDYGTEEVADHSIALSLALCRQIIPIDKECKKLGWEIPNKEKIRRLSCMNFGVVGLGRIGTSVALKAKALGFKTWFYDPYLSNGVNKSLNINREKDFTEFLKSMDIISVNCPLTEETRYMFTSKEFKLMKNTSFIVNTARGPIIKKIDLFKALKGNKLAGAALDVIEDEPLRTKEEAETPNLIATCHSGFFSQEASYEMRHSAATIAKAAIQNKELENCINEKCLPRNWVSNE